MMYDTAHQTKQFKINIKFCSIVTHPSPLFDLQNGIDVVHVSLDSPVLRVVATAMRKHWKFIQIYRRICANYNNNENILI